MGVAKDVLTGVTMAIPAVGALVVTAVMLSWTGLSFAAAYTAGAIMSLVGTLLLSRLGLSLVVTPSVAVTAYLVFIIAISNGLGWQQLLGISAAASLCGAMFWWWASRRSQGLFPPALVWGCSLAVAVYLIMQGLTLGRIIISSPWSVTMVGGFYDPLAYWSLVGIILTMALTACRCRNGLFYGMVFTLLATLAEGFWVIPAAPFFLPEGVAESVGQLTWTAGTAKESGLIFLTSLCLPLCLGAINASSIAAFFPAADRQQQCQGTAFISLLSLVGAVLGTVPLTIAPASAAGQGAGGRYVAGGAAAVLLMALCMEPLAAAWADFPAMAVPVLVGSGFLLILGLSKNIPLSAGSDRRRAELLAIIAIVLLLPLSNNFAVAIGVGILGYILFMVCAGKAGELSKFLLAAGALFLFYFAYSMFL